MDFRENVFERGDFMEMYPFLRDDFRMANLGEFNQLSDSFKEYDINRFGRALDYAMKQGIITPNMRRAIEFGSGLGGLGGTLAYCGFHTTMIEFEPLLVRGAKRIIGESKNRGVLKKSIECKVIEGSYISPEYQSLRESGLAIAPIVEKQWSEDEEEEEPEQMNFIPEASDPSPYRKVNLARFDVFVCYPWPEAIPSLYEIFRLYAKDDAILLQCGKDYDFTTMREAVLGPLELQEHIIPDDLHIPESRGDVVIITKAMPNEQYMSERRQEALEYMQNEFQLFPEET